MLVTLATFVVVVVVVWLIVALCGRTLGRIPEPPAAIVYVVLLLCLLVVLYFLGLPWAHSALRA